MSRNLVIAIVTCIFALKTRYPSLADTEAVGSMKNSSSSSRIFSSHPGGGLSHISFPFLSDHPLYLTREGARYLHGFLLIEELKHTRKIIQYSFDARLERPDFLQCFEDRFGVRWWFTPNIAFVNQHVPQHAIESVNTLKRPDGVEEDDALTGKYVLTL